MRIVLYGVETNNKGAELMLYAILREIESKYPDAEVFIPRERVSQGIEYVHTSLSFQYEPQPLWQRVASRLHIPGILRRLHLPYLWLTISIVDNVDYFIDGSGFAFSDQCNLSRDAIEYWRIKLKGYYAQRTRIIFLPQAFGPVVLPNTKQAISLIGKYATFIMPREKVSYAYLQQCEIPMDKVKLFTDFTSLIHGTFPEKYSHLKSAVCIIPNMRMIDKGTITLDEYLGILSSIIAKAKDMGKNVYLLNHEGKGDEDLAYKCQSTLKEPIEVVSGLNALEVKGLIASSYLCVTSRFHGVASALNSCVPCLATSWSHKYEELYKDYGLNNCVLELNNKQIAIDRVCEYLDENKNSSVRNHLKLVVPQIKRQSEEMWNLVWSL